MLVMVAHIKCKGVQRAIVRVCLVALLEHVVLRDKVTGNRMEPEGEEGARGQVEERAGTHRRENDNIKSHLNYKVDHVHGINGLRPEEEWPECIENRLENNPDEFGKRVCEQAALDAAGDVHV